MLCFQLFNVFSLGLEHVSIGLIVVNVFVRHFCRPKRFNLTLFNVFF